MFKQRRLVEDGRKVDHTFSQPDLIMAATVLQHGRRRRACLSDRNGVGRSSLTPPQQRPAATILTESPASRRTGPARTA